MPKAPCVCLFPGFVVPLTQLIDFSQAYQRRKNPKSVMVQPVSWIKCVQLEGEAATLCGRECGRRVWLNSGFLRWERARWGMQLGIPPRLWWCFTWQTTTNPIWEQASLDSPGADTATCYFWEILLLFVQYMKGDLYEFSCLHIMGQNMKNCCYSCVKLLPYFLVIRPFSLSVTTWISWLVFLFIF